MDKPADQHCLNCRYSFLAAENPQNLRNPCVYACRRFPPTPTYHLDARGKQVSGRAGRS